MRIVQNPWKTPARCIVIPHITQQSQGITWIDTNAEIPGGPRDNHVYVSDVAVRQMMEMLGYQSPLQVEALEARVETAEATAIELLAKLEAAEGKLAAVGVLQQAGVIAKPPRAKAAA